MPVVSKHHDGWVLWLPPAAPAVITVTRAPELQPCCRLFRLRHPLMAFLVVCHNVEMGKPVHGDVSLHGDAFLCTPCHKAMGVVGIYQQRMPLVQVLHTMVCASPADADEEVAQFFRTGYSPCPQTVISQVLVQSAARLFGFQCHPQHPLHKGRCQAVHHHPFQRELLPQHLVVGGAYGFHQCQRFLVLDQGFLSVQYLLQILIQTVFPRYRLTECHGTAFVVQVFERIALAMKQTAECFEKATLVVPSQFVAHGKSAQHIDGVFPEPCAGFCLIDIAVGVDTRSLPHLLQVDAIGSVGLPCFTTLIYTSVPFCQVDDNKACRVFGESPA